MYKKILYVLVGAIIGAFAMTAIAFPVSYYVDAVVGDWSEKIFQIAEVGGALFGILIAWKIEKITSNRQLRPEDANESTSKLFAKAFFIVLAGIPLGGLVGFVAGSCLSPATMIGVGNHSTPATPLVFASIIGFLGAIIGIVIGIVVSLFWLFKRLFARTGVDV